jgi:hypothetical protein
MSLVFQEGDTWDADFQSTRFFMFKRVAPQKGHWNGSQALTSAGVGGTRKDPCSPSLLLDWDDLCERLYSVRAGALVPMPES